MENEFCGCVFDILTETVIYRSPIIFRTFEEALEDAVAATKEVPDLDEFVRSDCYVLVNGLLCDADGERYMPGFPD